MTKAESPPRDTTQKMTSTDVPIVPSFAIDGPSGDLGGDPAFDAASLYPSLYRWPVHWRQSDPGSDSAVVLAGDGRV
jgi:hypothetical protein